MFLNYLQKTNRRFDLSLLCSTQEITTNCDVAKKALNIAGLNSLKYTVRWNMYSSTNVSGSTLGLFKIGECRQPTYGSCFVNSSSKLVSNSINLYVLRNALDITYSKLTKIATSRRCRPLWENAKASLERRKLRLPCLRAGKLDESYQKLAKKITVLRSW